MIIDPNLSLTETIIESKGVHFQSVGVGGGGGGANQQLPPIAQTFVTLCHRSTNIRMHSDKRDYLS